MLKKKFLSKILAIIMLVVTLLGTLPLSAFAKFITEIDDDAKFGVVSGSLSDYGHELHYAKYDSKTYLVFCAQYAERSPSGGTYEYNEDFIVQYQSDKKSYKKLCEMVYFGYVMKYGTGLPDSKSAKKAACATQQYVWEYIKNNINSDYGAPGRNSWDSTYMSSSIYSSWLEQAEENYNKYHGKGISFDGKTKQIEVGETKTYTDKNGVLETYETFSKTISGVTFSHTQGSNDLIVTVSESTNATTVKFKSYKYDIYQLMPNGDKFDTTKMSTYLYFKFNKGSIQNLLFSNYVDPESFTFNVGIESGELLLKKTDSTNMPLANCQFRIFEDAECTEKIATATTDENGEINFDGLSTGDVYVKEIKAAPGYLLDDTVKKVTISNGETATVTFKNNEPTGKILIYKVDSNGTKIGGAKFRVKAAADIKNASGKIKYYNSGDEIAVITSNEETGIATLDNMHLGKYIVNEIYSPEGYLLSNTTYTANLEYKNQTTPVVEIQIKDVVNTEPTGEITISKEDVDTGKAVRFDGEYHHGDANLDGTVYTLYANQDIYNKNRTVKYFSTDEEIATYAFNEKGIATAKVTNDNANLFASGNTIKNLPLGMYYSKETKAGIGYVLDTEKHIYNLEYKDSSTPVIKYNVTEKDRVQKAKFEVIKISSVENNTAKVIEGAEFTAILEKYVDKYGSFDEAKKHLSEFANDEYSVFTTGSNGHGVSSLLAYGKYVVNETYTPSPEINTVEEFKVTIDKDSDTLIKEFVENDTPFQAYLKIIKVDEETGKTITFSNATFSLYKQNDNKEWEKVKCKVGNKYVDSWSTDENGVATTETKIKAGKYKIDEIKVPDGFVKLEKDIIFNVNNKSENLEYDKDYDAHITVTVGNEKAKGRLNLIKTISLRENVDKTFINDIDFTRITFALYAKDDILDVADGSIITAKGTKIGEYNLDKNGKLKIDNLNLGSYFLKEEKTLDGVYLDTKEYDVVFKQNDSKTKTIDVNLAIENQTIITEFSKTTITGDGELEGAKLQVIGSEGIIDEWISEKDKTHFIEGLSVGKYVLREEIAPNNFVKATDVEFEILNSGKIQKVTMVDKVVEISKQDVTTGEELPGANLKIIDETGEIIEEWVSTDKPHYTSNLIEGKTYTLVEQIAPYSYETAESITFTVSYDKQNQKIVMKDKPILTNITLVKIDKDTKYIINAKFTFGLYEDKKCTKLIQQVDSNKKEGSVAFEELRYGTYYVKEITSPNNYKKSDKVVKIKINDKGVFIDGKEVTKDENSIYKFEFENEKIPDVHTGITFSKVAILIVAIISILIAVSGIIYLKKKK